MKKLLTILVSLLVLSACGNKAPTWEKVQNEYGALKQEAIKITENSETFFKQDYLNAIEELKELVANLEKTTDEESIGPLKKIYKLTYSIEAISSKYSGQAATKINNVAKIVDALIEANYDASQEEFDAIKNETLNTLEELDEISNKQWAEIEKKVLLKWEDVADAYEELASQARSEMTDPKEVTEAELDVLKNDIIDKYEDIAYGITIFNEDSAKDIYADAAVLEAYARRTTTEQGKTVRYFALDTMSYVKQCYGKVLDESEALEQDYPLSIEGARKWTQSVWNYITAELKKDNLN